MTHPRVLFAGTPEFGLASLAAMVEAGTVPVAVLTQPDRRAGRGKRLAQSPVKLFAQEKGILVLQPATLKDPDAVRELEALSPDLLVVAAYGLILPQNVLDIPTLDCINVHASLLPRWRGAAPIQAAILHGDAETGISLMRMTAGLDCGPVLATESLPIGDKETAGELHDRLAVLGGELLVRCLPQIIEGRLDAIEQDESQALYAPKIVKPDARIDWRRSARDIQRLVRAYNPVPGAWFELDGEAIKVWEVERASDVGGEPGEVIPSGKDSLMVACGEDGLRLERVQRPGKRRVSGAEFARAVDLSDRILSVPE